MSGDFAVPSVDFAVLYGLRGGAVCSGFSFPGKFVPGSMLVDELAGAARSVPALSAFSALSWPTLFSPVAAGCWRCLRRRSGRFGPLPLYPFSSPFSSPAGASRNFVLAALRSASRCSGSIPVTTVWASSRTSAYMARYISSDGTCPTTISVTCRMIPLTGVCIWCFPLRDDRFLRVRRRAGMWFRKQQYPCQPGCLAPKRRRKAISLPSPQYLYIPLSGVQGGSLSKKLRLI